VDVTAEAPQINTTSADFAPTLNQTAISNLPINGGRWSSFAVLTPGVVANSSGFGLLSFRGTSTLLNNNTVDGADNNQAFFSEERGRTRAGYSTPKTAMKNFRSTPQTIRRNMDAPPAARGQHRHQERNQLNPWRSVFL